MPISTGCPGTRRSATRICSPNEIVTAVELPAQGFATNYTYLKIRDRLSYAFALVSVAAALELEGDTIKEARLALGGVAHKPWRDPAAEAALRGQAADQATFARAADLLLRDAKGFEHNAFKIDLARRAIIRALTQAAAGTPQSQSRQENPMKKRPAVASYVSRRGVLQTAVALGTLGYGASARRGAAGGDRGAIRKMKRADP